MATVTYYYGRSFPHNDQEPRSEQRTTLVFFSSSFLSTSTRLLVYNIASRKLVVNNGDRL